MDTYSNLFNGFTWQAVLSLTLTIVLLGISAFMSASEVAFFSLTPTDLSKIEPERKKDKLVLTLLEKPEQLLATILIGNNLVNIGIVILSTYTTNLVFNFAEEAPILGFVFQTIIITFLLLLFGEVMPKIYANIQGMKMARFGAPFLKIVQYLFKPFSGLLVSSSDIINKRLARYRHTNISVDELSDALKLTTSDNDENSDILEGIVNFGNINVSQVMTSRMDMTNINIQTPFKKMLAQVTESGYSRIPVYQGSEDNIRGILYVKDLLPHLDKGNNFRWQSIVRPAYFVPETKMIDDLLTDFQKNKIHIAIVVDEFGGTSGLITMKDILEEIIGDISDEYDDEEVPLYKKINANTFLFEAKILLNDFFKIDEVNEEDFKDISNEVETLAGLILEIKGEIPCKGEEIIFKNYMFRIEKADNRHIEKILMKIKQINNDAKA